jgi:IS5 family transposase
VIRLTAGNVSDVRAVDELLAAVGPIHRLTADKGYETDGLRQALNAPGTTPVIPGRLPQALDPL